MVACRGGSLGTWGVEDSDGGRSADEEAPGVLEGVPGEGVVEGGSGGVGVLDLAVRSGFSTGEMGDVEGGVDGDLGEVWPTTGGKRPWISGSP